MFCLNSTTTNFSAHVLKMNVTKKTLIHSKLLFQSQPKSRFGGNSTCGRWVDLSGHERRLRCWDVNPFRHVFSRIRPMVMDQIGDLLLGPYQASQPNVWSKASCGEGCISRKSGNSWKVSLIKWWVGMYSKVGLSQVGCLHPLYQFLNMFFLPKPPFLANLPSQ